MLSQCRVGSRRKSREVSPIAPKKSGLGSCCSSNSNLASGSSSRKTAISHRAIHQASAASAAAAAANSKTRLLAARPLVLFYLLQDAPRMFVEFILEPLYKLLAHCVAEERPTLEPTLAEVRASSQH